MGVSIELREPGVPETLAVVGSSILGRFHTQVGGYGGTGARHPDRRMGPRPVWTSATLESAIHRYAAFPLREPVEEKPTMGLPETFEAVRPDVLSRPASILDTYEEIRDVCVDIVLKRERAYTTSRASGVTSPSV